MPGRYDRYAIVATLLVAGCDLVFPPGAGPTVDGRPLVDTDGDGVFDDEDNCIGDFNPEQLDGDGDGVGDACDNCVAAGNLDQHDEDGDTRGDACDTCPGMSGSEVDLPPRDGVGDVCDPNPCDQFDVRDVFAAFATDPGWQSDLGGSWDHSDDGVKVATAGAARYVAPYQPGLASVMTSYSVSSAGPYRIGVEVLAQDAGAWDAIRCVIDDDGAGGPIMRIERDGSALDNQTFGGPIGVPAYLILRLEGTNTDPHAYCELRRLDGSVQVATNAADVPSPGPYVGLYAETVEAEFHWFDVVRRLNATPAANCL